MQALQRRRAHEWTADDDALLATILALRAAWDSRCGRLTLADLGLETHCVTFVLSGLCPKHGQFVTEWTGRVSDALPLDARCTASQHGRCAEMSPAFVLV